MSRLALVVVLEALLAGTAGADNGLPRELDPRFACPLNSDPASQNRMAQIRAEVLYIINYRYTTRERAIRMGGITPQLEYQLAQLMQRRQALESELASRQAWAAREQAKCQAAVRAARVQRIGTVPIESLRQIPPDQLLAEERTAITRADDVAAVEQAARAQADPQQAARDKAERQEAENQAAMMAADPKLLRLILSAHLCYDKSMLAFSIEKNDSPLLRGQLDDQVEYFKDGVACTTKRFKDYNLTLLDCANKHMKELTHCLKSIYIHSHTIKPDSKLCLPEGDALVQLDELMTKRNILDKCATNDDDGAVAIANDPGSLTRKRARELGLSETKVSLSARRCNFIAKLKELATEIDPDSIPDYTIRAMLDVVNRQLVQTKIKPIACNDRMVQTVFFCLPSVYGNYTRSYCTKDMFTQLVMLVDRLIPLGVDIPRRAGERWIKN